MKSHVFVIGTAGVALILVPTGGFANDQLPASQTQRSENSPNKIDGGTCQPSVKYSFQRVSDSDHKLGPETFHSTNTLSKPGKATFTSSQTKTWDVTVSASLEIDVSAWVAGVKTNLGLSVSRSSTVTKGVSYVATVPPKTTIYGNYGWRPAKIRTTKIKKAKDCTTTYTSEEVRAPLSTGWLIWK